MLKLVERNHRVLQLYIILSSQHNRIDTPVHALIQIGTQARLRFPLQLHLTRVAQLAHAHHQLLHLRLAAHVVEQLVQRIGGEVRAPALQESEIGGDDALLAREEEGKEGDDGVVVGGGERKRERSQQLEHVQLLACTHEREGVDDAVEEGWKVGVWLS